MYNEKINMTTKFEYGRKCNIMKFIMVPTIKPHKFPDDLRIVLPKFLKSNLIQLMMKIIYHTL